MQFQPPLIRGSQRGFVVGKTNSGKSFVMRWLLKLFRAKGWRIVIVDPKRDWQGRGTKRTPFGGKGTKWEKGTVDHPVLTEVFDPYLAVQIFHPVEWDAMMDKMAQDIMATGNTIIYFDEVTQLASSSNVPRNFSILWTQGRALNVGAWCGTQRPVNVPVIVKDQAEVWLIFRLTRYEDRQTVEGYMPTEETPELVEQALPIRWFWFYTDEMEKPVLVQPLKINQEVKVA